MGIKFTGKAAAAVAAQPDEGTQDNTGQAGAHGVQPAPLSFVKPGVAIATAQAAPKSTVSWMKKGLALQSALQKDETIAAERKADREKLWRFRMKAGQERTVTFLDGNLDANGMLNAVAFREHRVPFQGGYQNYICTEDNEPCPICQGGDQSSLVFAFTIIDHTPYTYTSGQNAGKTVSDRVRLFACKRTSYLMLQKHATAQGGLAGVTFEITRTTDKSPGVGDVFVPTMKNSIADIQAQLPDAKVANYEEELIYRDAATLSAMGLGKTVTTIGAKSSSATMQQAEDLL
jgi:hypothetical protein